MMTVTHAIVGATTGRFIGSPVVAFAVNIPIHFLMDKVPHFLPKTDKGMKLMIACDAVLTTGFLLWVYLFGGPVRYGMLGGALGGVSVDALLVLTPLLKTKLGDWHVKRQNHRHETYFYYLDWASFLILLGLWWVLK